MLNVLLQREKSVKTYLDCVRHYNMRTLRYVLIITPRYDGDNCLQIHVGDADNNISNYYLYYTALKL